MVKVIENLLRDCQLLGTCVIRVNINKVGTLTCWTNINKTISKSIKN